MSSSNEQARKHLEAVGRALFGEQWISPLAQAVGVNRETIRRWLTGRVVLERGHGVFDDFLTLLHDRESAIVEARRKLQAWLEK